MKQLSILFLALMMVFASCDPQQKIAGNYTYDTECQGIAGDGQWSVRAFGKGKNKIEALAVAKRNALEEILFKGLRKGMAGCDQRPVLTDPNIREREQAYFGKFFSEGGEYLNYVSLKPNSYEKKMKIEGESNFTFGFELHVDYVKLKEKMKTDNLIKQQ